VIGRKVGAELSRRSKRDPRLKDIVDELFNLKGPCREMDWIDQAHKKRENQAFPKYGQIHPQTDHRCFRREMIEELLDALNYGQWGYEKGEIIPNHYWGIKQSLK
jgi:hypothetical protein